MIGWTGNSLISLPWHLLTDKFCTVLSPNESTADTQANFPAQLKCAYTLPGKRGNIRERVFSATTGFFTRPVWINRCLTTCHSPCLSQWWEASRHCLISRQYFHCLGLEGYCLGLVSVLTLIVSVLVLPLLSWSCASRPKQFKTPVEKCHQPTDSPETQWQSTWQWSNVRTLTQMNSQPFIPSHNSTVCGHSSRGYDVCLVLLHW